MEQYSLLEELLMSPKIDTNSGTYFPTEFVPSTWDFPPLDPDMADDQQHFIIDHHPFPYEDNNTLLDALITSPDFLLFGSSFYDDTFTGLPPITMPPAAEEVAKFLEINEDVTTPTTDDIIINNNAGLKMRSKSKKADGQPSKNLMAERRRRKRLNDRLSMLRSIVPKISKMDRTSILGDTIDYMKELLDKIRKARGEDDKNFTEDDDLRMIINGRDYLKNEEEINNNNNPNDTQVIRNPPKFDVERRNQYDTNVDVCCAAKPGLLLSTLTTLDALGLDIQQCVISCFSDFSCKASCFEVVEHRSLVSTEDVKLALFRNAGYGGRCL